MSNESPDLRPFKERVLELLGEVQPGSGLKPANEVLHRLRERIGAWVDERLQLYETGRDTLQSENQVLRGERDRLQRELDELRGMTPNMPAVAELATRLAKVEARLDKGGPMIGRDIVELREQVAGVAAFNGRLSERVDKMNDRIDQVVEIIGTRVEGLVNDIAVATDSAKRAHERLDRIENPEAHITPTPAFPTGGASTAEAAAEAVLPVPQRGDRVQFAPNTKTLGGANLRQQWAVVIGVSDGGNLVQVELDGEGDTRSIPWIDHADIMEVRHAQ